jgi:hypothetical protein
MYYFCDSLVWITSTGTTPDTFTRPLRFRRLPKPLNINGAEDVDKFKSWCSNNNDRYAFTHLYHSSWISTKRIKRFHIEFRCPDSLLSGTAISAIEILFSAFVRKAIRIGMDGAIAFNPKNKTRAVKFARRMTGNEEFGYRDDHVTAPLSDKEKRFLKQKTDAMIEWLKPELLHYGPEAYNVLKYMAKEPMSELAIGGMPWLKIDQKLFRIANKGNTKIAKNIESTLKRMALRTNDPHRWISLFAIKTGIPEDEVTKFLINRKDILWDNERGTFIVS